MLVIGCYFLSGGAVEVAGTGAGWRDFAPEGMGTTGKLRWPCASTARTAKNTLSFERFSTAMCTLPTASTFSHSAAVVARHTTSSPFARPSGDGSQVMVESFSSFSVTSVTFTGGAGADANDASVAALIRATFATYSKSTYLGRSP